MDSSYCKDCSNNTIVVLDRATGDTICSECGLVLDNHYIDEKIDWRNFTHFISKDDNYDPFDHAPQSTIYLNSKPNSSSTNVLYKKKFVDHHHHFPHTIGKRSADSHSHQQEAAFCCIADMADRLGVVRPIMVQAKDIYAKANDPKIFHARKKESIYAACLYIACRQAHTRTIKEICTVTNGVTMKEVARAKDLIVQHMGKKGESMEMNSVLPRNLLRRFCSALGMSSYAIQVAEAAADRVEKLDIRRNVTSIAATIIYLISTSTTEARDRVTLKDICSVAGLTDSTVKSCCIELRPYMPWILQKRKHL